MAWAAGIAALGGIAQSVIGGISSATSSKRAFNQSVALQAMQNAWMEKMANTAHQREVTDLKKAGLNPVLSATGGCGASTPQAGSSSGFVTDPDYQAGIATAIDIARLYNESSLRKSQNEVNATSAKLNEANANKADYEADSAHETAAYTNEQTRILKEFGPQIQQAIIEDIKASIRQKHLTTASTVKLNDALEWRARHQALGYSESHSESKGYNSVKGGQGIDITKLGRFGYDMSEARPYSSHSHSRTY